MLEHYINGVIRWHKLIVVVVMLMTALLGVGVQRLEIDHDVRAFLNPGDPILENYDNFRRTYGSDDNFFIVVVPEDESVFTPRSLQLIRDLGVAARDIPFFGSVFSLVESPYQSRTGTSGPAFRAGAGDAAAIEQLRKQALGDPLLFKRLVAPQGRAAAVKVTLALPPDQPDARAEALAGARAVVAGLASAHPRASITLAGNLAVSEGLSEAISDDLYKVTTATGILIFLLLISVTRSLYATIATMLVMTLSVQTIMGLVGWLGIKLTVVAGFVPAAIATLSVTDSIHLLVGYHAELRDGGDKISALKATVRHNAKAIFLTSLTSVLGFLTLNFSDAPPYRDMGNMIAAGMVFAFVMSILLWPALMAWFPVPQRTPRLLDARVMAQLGRWVVRRRNLLILVTGSFSLLLIFQAGRNSLTERWHEYLGPGHETRAAMDRVTHYFGGIHHVYYSLDSGRTDGIFDQEYLKTLDAFANWHQENPRVSHVVTFVDLLRRLGQIETESSDQYLLLQPTGLVKLSLRLAGLIPAAPGRPSMVSADNSATIVEVTYVPTDSAGLIEADENTLEWLDANAPDIRSSRGLGIDLVFSRINVANVHGILVGATIAMLFVSLVLIFLLRSPLLGMVSLIPNLIPIGLAFGVWGLTVGHIDMAVSVVMGISLGLVVDDTVHFLCKYNAARSGLYRNPADAVMFAYGRVATAIVVSSVVLMIGISGALFTDITPTRETAVVLMMTIGFAMLADLFLLPPLLALFDRR